MRLLYAALILGLAIPALFVPKRSMAAPVVALVHQKSISCEDTLQKQSEVEKRKTEIRTLMEELSTRRQLLNSLSFSARSEHESQRALIEQSQRELISSLESLTMAAVPATRFLVGIIREINAWYHLKSVAIDLLKEFLRNDVLSLQGIFQEMKDLASNIQAQLSTEEEIPYRSTATGTRATVVSKLVRDLDQIILYKLIMFIKTMAPEFESGGRAIVAARLREVFACIAPILALKRAPGKALSYAYEDELISAIFAVEGKSVATVEQMIRVLDKLSLENSDFLRITQSPQTLLEAINSLEPSEKSVALGSKIIYKYIIHGQHPPYYYEKDTDKYVGGYLMGNHFLRYGPNADKELMKLIEATMTAEGPSSIGHRLYWMTNFVAAAEELTKHKLDAFNSKRSLLGLFRGMIPEVSESDQNRKTQYNHAMNHLIRLTGNGRTASPLSIPINAYITELKMLPWAYLY